MNIEIRSDVQCIDGMAGRCSRVVVHQSTLQVSHIVVRENEPPHTERLVPLDRVIRTDADGMGLNFLLQELPVMDKLMEQTYTQLQVPDFPRYDIAFVTGDQIPTERITGLVKTENLPPGEVAIDSNTWVEATDGKVGQAGALEVEPESGRITSLTMRKGPPWAEKRVVIPSAYIDRLDDGTVYLKLDRQGVEVLPGVLAGK